MAIYPQASTMVELNKEIKGLKGKKSQRELTKQYNVSRLTIRNWQNRDEREGRHHRPHTFQAKQTPVRERLASELRRLLLLPLGHLLVITWELIHLIATRSGIYRTLNRHGAFRLREPETACKEEGGEQIQEGGKRKYLYVAIDRVSRWGYIETLFHKSVSNAIEFLKWLIEKPPFNISRILTDNDKEVKCRVPCNYIPERSYPLFQARDLLQAWVTGLQRGE